MYFITWYGIQGPDNIKIHLINLTIYYTALKNCQLESEQESRVKCDIDWDPMFYININHLHLCHHWTCVIDQYLSDLADYYYYNSLAHYIVNLTLLQYKIDYKHRVVLFCQNLTSPVQALAWIIKSQNTL